jgi:hypothetical protein
VLQELERVLLSKWKEFDQTGNGPEHFQYVLSAERHWHSKAVLYCLPQDGRRQAVVVKIQKESLKLPLLENEYVHLKALHGHERLRDLRASIPRPLFFGEMAGHPVLVQTYVPGVPFSKFSRRRDPEWFLRLSEWLRRFHVRTLRAPRFLTGEDIGVYFLHPLESAMRTIKGDGSLGTFLNDFGRKAEELCGASLTFVFNHNDLTLNNIRFHGDRVGVIDWEFSRDPDLPLSDLMNAFLFFAMTWKRVSYPEAFRLAFAGGSELSLLLRRCLRDYFRDLGLSPAMLVPLVVQYLISRILLLKSIGSVEGCEDTLCCLNALADGRVGLAPWDEVGLRDRALTALGG